jgi:hypothetical protein
MTKGERTMLNQIRRTALNRNLDNTEKRIVQLETAITRQRAQVAWCEDRGHDASTSQGLLDSFRQSLDLYYLRRSRILAELRSEFAR